MNQLISTQFSSQFRPFDFLDISSRSGGRLESNETRFKDNRFVGLVVGVFIHDFLGSHFRLDFLENIAQNVPPVLQILRRRTRFESNLFLDFERVILSTEHKYSD